MQRGGGSKDTWVVSEGPVTAVSLLAPTRLSVRRERLDAELLSRVADNLFWLGRHIERAEQTARLLRSLVTMTREDMSEGTPELVALLHVLVEMGMIPPQLRESMGLPALEHQLSLLFTIDTYPVVAHESQRGAPDRVHRARSAFARHVAHSQSASRTSISGMDASSWMTCSCT